MNIIYYLQPRKATKKVRFFIASYLSYLLPRFLWRFRKRLLLASLSQEEKIAANLRSAYYCRIPYVRLLEWQTTVGTFRFPYRKKKKHSAYFFDLYNCVKYFPSHRRFNYLFGDVDFEPDIPTFVKSRPITATITNSVVLKLNAVRHFNFVHDTKTFREKKDILVSRNAVHQPWRTRFLEVCFGQEMFDVGQINSDYNTDHPEWVKPYLTIAQQLDYKFIACIEGNDVATNLKWVMSSNSIAVMPRPKYETWFMEGTLIPNYHYIEVKPDYSDITQKLKYYIAHPEAAEAIIQHAHQYVAQFLNERLELATQLYVAEKYFQITN